jgi:1-phosphofructokinase family hexose kinase
MIGGTFDVLSICLAPTFQRTLFFDRISSGGVNRAREAFLDASGKGVNACRALAMAGGSAIHLTHSGGPLAPYFARLCEESEIDLDAIATEAGIRTCVTAIDADTGKATELVEECPAVEAGVWERVFDRAAELLPRARIVLFSGKPAAGYPPHCAAEIAGLCAEAGKPFVIDCRGGELVAALARKPILCKPNAEEFVSTFGCPQTEDGIASEAARLSADTGAAFLITRGGDAAIFAQKGSAALLRVRRVAALNPVGSGDACAAGVCLKLARGEGLAEAAVFGLELGSRSAGTARPGWL